MRDGRIVVSAGHAIATGRGAPEIRSLFWAQVRARAADVSRALLRLLRSRAFSGSVAVLPLMCGATAARAQALQPLVAPALDPEYNRGRNVSVTEEFDPAYQPLGVRSGSIIAYPSIGVTTGATNNVFNNNARKSSDAFYIIAPAVRVTTDWSLHQFNLIASADLQRYRNQESRNQDSFFISAESRLDLGPDLKVAGRVQYSRVSETPFTSDISAEVSVLSQFVRLNPSVSAVYNSGRFRVTARADAQKLNFNVIEFADGTTRDQRERNRTSKRGSLQTEYALSPSIAVFGQGTVEQTDFPFPRRDGRPSRSSKGYTALVGFNFDLAGLMRGSTAVGYTQRNYNAAGYETVGGPAIQVQGEFFISPLTTLGVGVQRVIQDANSPYNAAYSDTRASVTVDHALLRNLILTTNVLAVRQKILDSSANSKLLRTTFSARYQTSRAINIGGSLAYSRARTGALPLGVPYDEFRGEVSLRLRR